VTLKYHHQHADRDAFVMRTIRCSSNWTHLTQRQLLTSQLLVPPLPKSTMLLLMTTPPARPLA